ncbi:MAG: acyl-CoA dehydrogenase family protein [Myxococcales bacterium]|nr:acyl-CoA dehydrogenase family protein [Myxococcales bacterium]
MSAHECAIITGVTHESSLRSLLDAALARSIDHPTYATVDAFWRAHVDRSQHHPLPFDRAVLGGLFADTVGQAFTAGYRAALQALFDTLSPSDAASFCVTERGGGHPRAIETTLENAQDDRALTGEKTWISLADGVVHLLVVAREGTHDDGRPKLRIVHVDSSRAGVTVTPMSIGAMVPDVLHGSVRFDRVRVADSELLAGDGYARYVKPFRTVEDVHVFGALLGYLVAVARSSEWPPSVLARLASSIATLRALAVEPPDDPVVHVALDGALSTAKALVSELDLLWESAAPDARDRWNRDRVLLSVAQRARDARTTRALEALSRR